MPPNNFIRLIPLGSLSADIPTRYIPLYIQRKNGIVHHAFDEQAMPLSQLNFTFKFSGADFQRFVLTFHFSNGL